MSGPNQKELEASLKILEEWLKDAESRLEEVRLELAKLREKITSA